MKTKEILDLDCRFEENEEIFIRPRSEHSLFSINDGFDLFSEITWENSPVEFIENKEE